MIINWSEIVGENAFYNGGWVKGLDGLDLDKTGGYAYIGPFVSNAKNELTECPDGLYLVCSIEGSRKNQVKNVAIYRIQGDEVNQESDWAKGNDWSLKLRAKAQQLLAVKVNPLEAFSSELLIEELKARGFPIGQGIRDKMAIAMKQTEPSI